jgi:hypothetical protein
MILEVKFFIPLAESDDQSARVYRSIKKCVASQVGDIKDRKIYRIRFLHDGKTHLATVGEVLPYNGEIVIAILEGSVFYICTYNRGVAKGAPILVRRDLLTEPQDFDNE